MILWLCLWTEIYSFCIILTKDTCYIATKDLQPTAPCSSQGWASRCLVLCCWLVFWLLFFVVTRLFVWVGWLGVFSFLFSLPSSWCAMHLYVHAYWHTCIGCRKCTHVGCTDRGVGRIFSERCDCRSVSEACKKYRTLRCLLA